MDLQCQSVPKAIITTVGDRIRCNVRRSRPKGTRYIHKRREKHMHMSSELRAFRDSTVRTILASSVPVLLGVVFIVQAFGWGWDAHAFFNRSTVYHLPGQMALFIQDSSFFALHSPDADQRKVSGDTSLFAESPRHFLDIDDYPDYQNLSRDLDTLIATYGWERVKANGTLPWATTWTFDSLVTQLSRGDWGKATLTASDLGHYVADAHQPLHCARNYDGQYTNNRGIHRRYETEMLSPTYSLSSLFIVPDSVWYVADPLGYSFDYILHANSLVDTILRADTFAKSASGWNGSGDPPASYYSALWEKTGTTTLDQMQEGTQALANLWYTAWVDAGLITPTGVPPPVISRPADLRLTQNFPNPFNALTTISYHLPVGGTASLKVYSLDGELVATIVEGNQSAGEYLVRFDGSNLASGVYLYRLRLGGFVQTRKLLMIK